MTTITTTLRAAIKSDSRTHHAIARTAGVAPIQIGRFVRGERDITLATADKLAAALGLRLVPGKPIAKRA